MAPNATATTTVEDEIVHLERRLREARARLPGHRAADQGEETELKGQSIRNMNYGSSNSTPDHLHNLLLLSDSALPLGSFAFSSGLESFLAHQSKAMHAAVNFSRFLTLSLESLASTTFPFVIAGYEEPGELENLDNDLDASTSCVVAKRASIKQGRAMLSVWERSFRLQMHRQTQENGIMPKSSEAREALDQFTAAMKTQQQRPSAAVISSFGHLDLNGHLAPLFGASCAALEIPLPHALYLYMFNHAKTIVSAGIRASVLGPYQAQSVLASQALRNNIWVLVEKEIGTDGRKARRSSRNVGQNIPMLDLWGGRHEILYSRIFNS